MLAFETEAISQEVIPAPPADAQTVKLSDLAPEVVSKIKSDHYAAQDQNIQQTYHRQLEENRKRSAFAAQQAAFEQSAGDRGRGGFSPAAYQAPVQAPAQGTTQAPQLPSQAASRFQGTVVQASHNAAFPRTAANEPDKPIAQTAAQSPSPTYSAPQSTPYSAPQTFMPPVHITPAAPQYSGRNTGRTLSGNRRAVQNFAPQASRPRTAANQPYRQPIQHARKTAPRAQPKKPQPSPAQVAPKDDTHVFLQDRIASALSRHFKRGKKEKEQSAPEPIVENELNDAEGESVLETATLAPPVYQPSYPSEAQNQSPITFAQQHPAPVKTTASDLTVVPTEKFVDDQSYSEILQGNKYAELIQEGVVVSGDRPANHNMAAQTKARRRSIERAVDQDHRIGNHDDDVNDDVEPFDLSVDDEEPTILDRYENIRLASVDPVDQRQPASLRGSAKRRSRLASYSRPDKYSRAGKKVPAENVSILLQEEENVDDSPFADADQFKPAQDDIDLEAARDAFDLDSERSQGSGTKNRPNLRDDLEDANEGASSGERFRRDRVRSRLDDELDLEQLDREIDEELDQELNDNDFDEGDRPDRAPRKTCRQFQDELIAGSIRDISLDISPPAASEGAQYGGLARTWTDRRGNILATGALTDLRRGYVILDTGQKLAYARLSEADLAAVSEFWRLPEVCVIGNRGGSPYRSWTPQVVTWKASNLCHKPLYFENTQLERYGHSRGPVAQPIHSTLHFFTRLVALPYMTGICPPNECEYALGYYRPGNCAPWLKEPIPISLEGIRREALFVTGAAFIP